MPGKALIIGNSDGIGLAATIELIKRGWTVVGISRSETKIKDYAYEHYVADVRRSEFADRLKSILDAGPVELCMYCAGIGELLDISYMKTEAEIFDVNLIGMVKTAACVIPAMAENGNGHFIGLSSVADEMLSAEAPSYHASKAGFSNYLEGLALALKPKGVFVSNVRFGFVDTKMAKSDVKPFMMSVERAVHHLMICMDKKPVRYTAPGIVIPLVKLHGWMIRLRAWFSSL